MAGLRIKLRNPREVTNGSELKIYLTNLAKKHSRRGRERVKRNILSEIFELPGVEQKNYSCQFNETLSSVNSKRKLIKSLQLFSGS